MGKRIDHDEFLDLLRRAFDRAGGQGKWAKKHMLSPSYVSEVNRSKSPPSEKLLAALGLTKEAQHYRRLT